jgi:hypothetical protein
VPGHYAVWIQRAAQSDEERARMRREAIAEQTTTSEVTFAHVALHQEYTLWVSAPLPTSLVTVAGPTAEQPAIDVVLELSRESAIFTGRAVDEAGAPLAERHLEFFASNGDAADSGRMRTDAQGNFLFAVKAVVLRRPLEALHLGLLEGRIRRTGIGADLSDLAPLVTGARALGDVVFSRQPVLAAGRITIDGIATDLRPDLWLEARRENGRWSGVGAALSWSEQGFELRGARPRGRLHHAARPEDHACAAAAASTCARFAPSLSSSSPSSAIEGRSKIARSEISARNTSRRRNTSCVTSSECPPRRKKLSWMPTRSTCSSSDHTRASTALVRTA